MLPVFNWDARLFVCAWATGAGGRGPRAGFADLCWNRADEDLAKLANRLAKKSLKAGGVLGLAGHP